jgi:hypothetical protein
MRRNMMSECDGVAGTTDADACWQEGGEQEQQADKGVLPSTHGPIQDSSVPE